MKRILQNALIFILTTMIIFIFVEGVIRITNAAPGRRKFEIGPDEYIIVDEEFSYYVKTNSLGLRDHREFSSDMMSHTALFLGDSFTYGVGVSNNETFPSVTDDYLSQVSEQSWSVVNAGQPGTGTIFALDRLKNLESVLDVDLVILFYFVDNDPYETQIEYNKQQGTYRATEDPNRSLNLRIRAWAQDNIATYRFLRNRVPGLLHGFRAVPMEFFDQTNPEKYSSFEEIDQITRNAIEEMRDDLAEQNIPFAVVILPRQEQLSEDRWETFAEYYNMNPDDFDRKLPQHRIINEVFAPLDIEFFDLLPCLERIENHEDYYFRVDGHFTEQGNNYVGHLMDNAIRSHEKTGEFNFQCLDSLPE